MKTLVAEASRALDTLMAGNARFCSGQSIHRTYTESELNDIASVQKPIAAVVSCSDSRVTPEVVFDQPLGSIFCARVPGAVASDAALWTADIATTIFHVPLVMVVGHTGCLAIAQIVDGADKGVGGPLRSMISYAVYKAKAKNHSDLLLASIEENIRQTVEEMPRRCASLHTAVLEGRTSVIGAVYEMETGRLRLCD